MTCLDRYRTRYASLIAEMKAEVDEYLSTGRITRAEDLSSTTGQPFCFDRLPGFFGGDPDASVVVVHLNPKSADPPSPDDISAADFEDWFDRSRHFGEHVYGPSAPRTHRSPFDHKQVRFLQPLDVLPFVEEQTRDDRYTNLEIAIDGKLQLELIPYGSPSFSTRGLTDEVLKPHFERVIGVVAAHPRRFILFCGAVFEPILRDYIVERHTFHLTKNDGTPERQVSAFSNLTIPYDGTVIKAGLAHSWARQGIPMRSYAEQVRRFY